MNRMLIHQIPLCKKIVERYKQETMQAHADKLFKVAPDKSKQP